ncbi:MAG: hypothetical protein AUJ52_07390 [Elusimicrobia bacterium CG1_02_63_36]|nr:MAG: hypothetical protein AUJ52_07390 [Elusimicrobia bacterium CG1_02_63_36]PIP82897.1 MAG: hypothetical protein COR54_12405 [Elusimicrobia bacterium CG22_combo_CG10-13_8_21_14_all_63_91]PJA15913.1 MAG: hypothetical protein COX66_08740 [Elusimicrobia bacterium CG_4_10_14_0_2_um_filter_63_34]PJB25003.1 MAG: hypothetical protein CO113_10915 [Elusimicrobia bacterium CG_4_9_14_3_um_filter_62_55]
MPEQNIHDDFVAFLKILNKHEVEYLVIGGHAVGFHGRPRDTGDIDIVIKPTRENAARLVRAVSAFGAGGLGYTEDDYLSGDFIQFGVAPVRIDITILFVGVESAALWDEAVVGQLGGVSVRFPSKKCLLANKRATGRPKDLRDAETLDPQGRDALE